MAHFCATIFTSNVCKLGFVAFEPTVIDAVIANRLDDLMATR